MAPSLSGHRYFVGADGYGDPRYSEPRGGAHQVSVYSFIIGIGLGLSTTPLTIAVQSAVSWARRGVVTATNLFVRSFGTCS